MTPLIYGCFNVVNNNISMTSFMIQNATIPGMLMSVTDLEHGKSLYREAQGAATRLNHLLNTPVEQFNENDKVTLNQAKGTIRFDNISFDYSGPKVLDNISFDIPAKGLVLLLVQQAPEKVP
jgi:ATP-binding cassette subfamily B protein